jgi:hypothetical protein
MKVYYTYQGLEVVDDLEHLARESLENTGVFGRFWAELSSLPGSGGGTSSRASVRIQLAPGYAIYFLGGKESLCQQLSAVYGSDITTTTQQGVVVAAKIGIELSLGTKFDQVGRTVAHAVTKTAGSAVAGVTNVFRKLTAKKLTTSGGDVISTAEMVHAPGMDAQKAGELIELQHKTLSIVCVYNADTYNPATKQQNVPPGGMLKSNVINTPLTIAALGTLLKQYPFLFSNP